MKLRALTSAGFSLSFRFGDKQEKFQARTLGGEAFIPDHIASDATFAANVNRLIADGLAELVQDDQAKGHRLIKVDGAELVTSPTPVPLSLQGEPVASVVLAVAQTATDTLVFLTQGPAADFDVVDGEVFWVGGTVTHKFAFFWVA